ncbi:hypothetical protein GQ472_06135 [archaeon]|nr:hypothetical protein [archaeon]
MGLGYEDLEKHLGHKILIIGYESHSSEGAKECINLECMDCNEVLIECSRDIKDDKDKEKDMI